MDYTTRSTCRLCDTALIPILTIPHVAFPRFPTTPTTALPWSPLTWCWCPGCTLVQIQEKGRPDLLYNEYWYRSGTNEVMRHELHEVVRTVRDWTTLTPTSIVLDVGANDGTLLDAYRADGPLPYRVGLEPSGTFTTALSRACEHAVHDLWPSPQLLGYRGRVQALTTIAVLYALEDPLAAAADAAQLLAPDGVWVIQFQDLAQMIQAHAVDNICLEHVAYFTLHSLQRVLETNGLRVVDCVVTPINGGSLRVVVKHRGGVPDPAAQARIQTQLAREDALGLLEEGDLPTSLRRFASGVGATVRQTRALIAQPRAQGQPVDWYGASTKSLTLLTLLDLPPGTIRQCWERSPQKVGRYVGPFGIPIVAEEDGRRHPPELLVAGIWQFRAAVLRRERAYLQHGVIAFPLPACELVMDSVAPAVEV